MPNWQRLVIAGVVILGTLLVAKLIDVRMGRRKLAPGAETRYRVLRRSIMSGILFVGVLSALLALPQVRSVAGALLASSAVIGLIIGFAAQRTIGNFIAGLLIALSQPLRIGDRVSVDGMEGTVEEIALTYTYIRADDNTRLVIPNEKLASDTIQNSTVARERQPVAFVSGLADRATITLRAWAPSVLEAHELESDLRVRAHARLRAHGIYA